MGYRNQMLRLFVLTLMILVIGCLPAYANSIISLGFAPSNQSVLLGSTASVDVNVINPGGTLIGAYDFNIEYDPTILSPTSVDFGSGLGAPLDSLASFTLADPLNVAELSFLWDFTGYQDGVSDFTLFTVHFDTIGLGVSPLSFSENILGIAGGFLGDDWGEPIQPLGLGTGSIEVVIPEPGTLLLVGIGIAGIALYRRQRS